MATVAEHYRNVLADVYSWMLGGFEAGIARNVEFFRRHGVRPQGSGIAIDLGTGCGFQAIPLARAGFSVTAIDLDPSLLDELERHRGESAIHTVPGDLMDFDAHIDRKAELIVCMTDTLLHLESAERINALFAKVHSALEPGGRFIATFRNLSSPVRGLDRFLPVRSDDSRILTCYLEYEDDRVKVHDLLYEKQGEEWKFSGSYYYKLRIPPERMRDWLLEAKFDDVRMTTENGLVTIIASR